MSKRTLYVLKLFTKEPLSKEKIDRLLDVFGRGELEGYTKETDPVEVESVLETRR